MSIVTKWRDEFEAYISGKRIGPRQVPPLVSIGT